MKRQKWTIGAIVKIPISKNRFSYGQLLDKSSIAIFDIIASKDYTIQEILKFKTLFIVAIYSNIISTGTWQKIGKEDLKEDLKILPLKFIQNTLDPEIFELYNPNTGEITRATREDCVGLERAAVWEAEHIVSRINDHFSGKVNVWVEQLRLK
jgi:hypothetical protein